MLLHNAVRGEEEPAGDYLPGSMQLRWTAGKSVALELRWLEDVLWPRRSNGISGARRNAEMHQDSTD
jgi:hypothetical protein